MKVTALIPDPLVNDVKKYTQGKNITQALITALEEWVALQKVYALNKRIAKKPLQFQPSDPMKKIREVNRKLT